MDYIGHVQVATHIAQVTCNSFKCLYQSCSPAYVDGGGRPSGWFLDQVGVRQGDSLLSILSALFINDLANDIKQLRAGMDTSYCQMSLLLYADDIVLLAANHRNAQQMLDVMGFWCCRWGMKVDIMTSEVVYINRKWRTCCISELKLDDQVMKYVPDYKYLLYSMWLICPPGGQLWCGSLELHQPPIASDGPLPRMIENWIGWFYVGAPCFASLSATRIRTKHENIQYLKWPEMVRLFN